MRLVPKRVGNSLGLNDYNACQHLLYTSEWTDTCVMNTASKYTGKYLKYKLDDNDLFYEVKDLLYYFAYDGDNILLDVSILNKYFRSLHIGVKCTFYYKSPFVDTDGTLYDPEIPEELAEDYDADRIGTPSLDDYETITIPCSFNWNRSVKSSRNGSKTTGNNESVITYSVVDGTFYDSDDECSTITGIQTVKVTDTITDDNSNVTSTSETFTVGVVHDGSYYITTDIYTESRRYNTKTDSEGNNTYSIGDFIVIYVETTDGKGNFYSSRKIELHPLLNTDSSNSSYVETTTTYDPYIDIPLKDENDEYYIPLHSLIHRHVDVVFQFYEDPYVDLYNGEYGSDDEVWIDNREDLRNVIDNAPVDGTKLIIRLDANKSFLMTSTMYIRMGMNIEIRGGNNQRSVIDGQNICRLFRVEKGASLTLVNIELCNANSLDVSYMPGLGGAVYVEHDSNVSSTEFGLFYSYNCKYVNNTALYGGAIYSEHCGLFIYNSLFSRNNSVLESEGGEGGAICYIADPVTITCPSQDLTTGETAIFIATVVDFNGEPVSGGYVSFYIEGEDDPIYKVKPDTATGMAEFVYTVPEDYDSSTLVIYAVYNGDKSHDVAGVRVVNSVNKIIDYTIKLLTVSDNTVSSGDKVEIKALVVDQDGHITTVPDAKLSVCGSEVSYERVDNYYVTNYTASDVDELKVCSIVFELVDFDNKLMTITLYVYPKFDVTSYDKTTAFFMNQIKSWGRDGEVFVDDDTLYEEAGVLIDSFISHGITDVYVRMSDYNSPSKLVTARGICKACETRSIRCHVTFNCFSDGSGNYYPLSKYPERLTWLLDQIKYVLNNLAIDGIDLDYFRFFDANQDSSKEPLMTDALEQIVNMVKSHNNSLWVSVCMMPEKGTKIYYGQYYSKWAGIADILMPMVYRSTYPEYKDDARIVSFLQWANSTISESARLVPIIATGGDYNSDDGTSSSDVYYTPAELEATISEIIKADISGTLNCKDPDGAEYNNDGGHNIGGVCLFRYGNLRVWSTSEGRYVETFISSYEELYNKLSK